MHNFVDEFRSVRMTYIARKGDHIETRLCRSVVTGPWPEAKFTVVRKFETFFNSECDLYDEVAVLDVEVLETVHL